MAAVAATLGAASMVFASATPASAGGYTVEGCKPGQVCLYHDFFNKAHLIEAEYGTLKDRRLSGYKPYFILNNGRHDPGQDHYYFQIGSGAKQCLHYTTIDGVDNGSFSAYWPGVNGAILRNQKWSGECP